MNIDWMRLLDFMIDDVLPGVCVFVSLQTVWINYKDLKVIKTPRYRVIVYLSSAGSFLSALVFFAVLLEADHLFGQGTQYTFGPVFIRPIITYLLILFNLMAHGRRHISKEVIADDNPNAITPG